VLRDRLEPAICGYAPLAKPWSSKLFSRPRPSPLSTSLRRSRQGTTSDRNKNGPFEEGARLANVREGERSIGSLVGAHCWCIGA
jgi:hypothetical protein